MEWRRQRGISRKLFAEMADFSERKLATYEKAMEIPEKVQRPITETVHLIQALTDLAGDSEALADWLHTPNPAFGKATPISLITAGESHQLWEMVHQLRQGTFQ